MSIPNEDAMSTLSTLGTLYLKLYAHNMSLSAIALLNIPGTLCSRLG